MTIITPGRRPTIDEVRAYYSRPEILNEILQAMQRWHVRFLPGYSRQSWVYTEDPAELHALMMQSLDLMQANPERTEYPYFRINWERYHPAHSWDKDTLWGYDFVIEKDSFLWQECFEAMLPVMDILDDFGVYYWLKYTGHHSLHLVIPAECFPHTLGPSTVPLTEVREAIYHRLMVFLNKRARQHYNEHNRHCPPGTNMPYSVNEDTGLVNTPLLREELATFRPWQASIYLVQARDFWRTVPGVAHGCAATLLAEVLKPFGEQARFYPPLKDDMTIPDEAGAAHILSAPFTGRGDVARQSIAGRDTTAHERRLAVWQLMLDPKEEELPIFIAALVDEDADTRWFVAEALSQVGPPEILPALLAMPHDDMAGACWVDFCVRHGEAAIPVLIEALKHFKSMWVSLPVDRALERIGAASIPYLKKLLDNPDSNIRKNAACILERISGTPTLDEVLAMSTRHNREHDAALMLGWYDDACAHRRLAELAQEPRNDHARRNAIKALLWTDHPDAEQLLRHALDDKNDKVRHWAQYGIELLAQIKRSTQV
ncbi:MAG: HEAT repeat domain-containing protein [Anaerolineae bacterium]|nr:HEAT repeat domain-containing protein [Anaerolineae bacterium]